jgi:hypothetical protein
MDSEHVVEKGRESREVQYCVMPLVFWQLMLLETAVSLLRLDAVAPGA